jgi:uncharacterized membrane protein
MVNRLFRVVLVAAAAAVIAWLWYTSAPELFRAGMPSITEDADFALLVRLTGFVVIVTVAVYFAAKNLPRK